jgi:hypothetical protein
LALIGCITNFFGRFSHAMQIEIRDLVVDASLKTLLFINQIEWTHKTVFAFAALAFEWQRLKPFCVSRFDLFHVPMLMSERQRAFLVRVQLNWMTNLFRSMAKPAVTLERGLVVICTTGWRAQKAV